MMEQKRTYDSNQITTEYFDSILLEMRHLDNVIPSTKLELYGKEFDTPVMMAALSHLNGVHPNGMAEMAQGAFMANAVNWSGMGEYEELEAMCSTGAKTIKIIKPHADNKVIFDKIKHAEKCGALAVGMDIDHAFNSNGQYDTVCGLNMRPKSLSEIKEFVASTRLPFIIKGVLSEQDTEKCLDAGVQGIVVSHHHGIMNYAIPPLMILPKIAKIVNGRIPIFVDCCFQNGMDVFKALALGATAVSVGRAIMDPLKKDGATGVYNTIQQINAELAGTMARTGFATLNEINDSILWRK